MRIRDVIALDGEGISPVGDGGPHWYTLLNSYDTRYRKHRYIEQWEGGGLSTERILSYLCWQRKTWDTIVCTYYGNYDVTCWIKDLDDESKQALWQAGWVVWRAPSGALYWLEYVPSKSFFVGQYEASWGLRYNRYDWPARHLLVYDVSGFAQQSFVKTLAEWQIDPPMGRSAMQEMKEGRHAFTAMERDAITAYNRAECVALAQYVQQLDETFQAEGVKLRSWHGGGALASHYLLTTGVAAALGQPDDAALEDAIMHAYFGGRNELVQQGHFGRVYDWDINSAYPAACLDLPNLARGRWRYCTRYDPGVRFGLWHVRWDLEADAQAQQVASESDRGSDPAEKRTGITWAFGPFPFRYKRGVYYPFTGSGWYHAAEVAAAIRHYGPLRPGVLDVTGGWAYDPASADRPFHFVSDLAAARVRYKSGDPKRAQVYKLALNSLYGKLAQHTTVPDKPPRWQCYVAAGYVTAATRARLLDLAYQGGRNGQDVIMMATDGLFTLEPRDVPLTATLGQWSHKGVVEDVYIVQAGVWYGRSGGVRSRGFGVRSLDYERISSAWRTSGPSAVIPYDETRFIGLGTCCGLGDFSRYARWHRVGRELTFTPDRKFAPPWHGEENIRLTPMDFRGQESEIYEPARERDPRGATLLLDRLMQILDAEDQPDLDDV